MTLIKLIFVVTTLTLQRNKAQGQMFVSQGEGKAQDLKVANKRIDNFQVPVETQFDPNFWPARGRRGGDDPRAENCLSPDENFVYHKGGCVRAPGDGKNGHLFRNDFLERTCSGLLSNSAAEEAREECERKLRQRIPETLERNFLHRAAVEMQRRRYKKQRHSTAPIVWSYGDGFFWSLDDSFGEKEKKQDVFWVARGKKTF